MKYILAALVLVLGIAYLYMIYLCYCLLVSNLFGKFLIEFIKKKFCKHKKLEHIWTDYQDRYTEYECEICKKRIFKDI